MKEGQKNKKTAIGSLLRNMQLNHFLSNRLSAI